MTALTGKMKMQIMFSIILKQVKLKNDVLFFCDGFILRQNNFTSNFSHQGGCNYFSILYDFYGLEVILKIPLTWLKFEEILPLKFWILQKIEISEIFNS